MTAAAMPDRIGRFRLRSMLGRGAMGIVYLGHDEEIDRLVAIKLIRADLLDTEEREGYLKRFRNEAKIAGRCMHANIVGLYDFAMHEENPYLVMEYVDGIGLQQFFPRGTRRPVQEVVQIALQVLDALHYAHARSIVHRDIKPANILMMPDLSLKITDFGISRLTSMELTATPLLIGTPSYMSPEQCIGSALDGRNDLFSLGCVLYELLAGERAFSGVNYTETIFGIVNRPHVPLHRLRDDLPPGLSEAIDRALAKSPEHRFPDAAAFARTLDEIARAAALPRTGMPPVIGTGPRYAPTPTAAPTAAAPSPSAIPAGTEPGEPAGEDDTIRPVPPVAFPVSSPGSSPVSPTAAPAAAPAADAGTDADPGSATASHDAAGDVDATLIRSIRPLLDPAHAAPPPEPPPVEMPVAMRTPDPLPAPALAAVPSPVPDAGTTVSVSPATAPPAPVPGLDAAPVASPARLPEPDRFPDPAPASAALRSAALRSAAPASGTLGARERDGIAECLARVIGPIAPVLLRRAERPGMDAPGLADALSGFIREPQERDAFHALLRREGLLGAVAAAGAMPGAAP